MWSIKASGHAFFKQLLPLYKRNSKTRHGTPLFDFYLSKRISTKKQTHATSLGHLMEPHHEQRTLRDPFGRTRNHSRFFRQSFAQPTRLCRFALLGGPSQQKRLCRSGAQSPQRTAQCLLRPSGCIFRPSHHFQRQSQR